MVHFQRIQEFIRGRQDGWITGSAYRLDVGFPVVLEQGTERIAGQILELEAPALLEELLDRFHGVHPHDPTKSLFYPKEVEVRCLDGLVPATVYFMNPDRLSPTAQPIPGGDWKSMLQQRPILLEKLNDKQKQYILRLGATKGREIIPIDLALYRELVNLEIIVDKGRRLALTKLGHEVYRYLS